MKIICMARNYAAHARELNNPPPASPVFFMKHENCIVRNNKPFFYPDFSEDIHHEVEVVLRISKVGKNIVREYALGYVDQVGLGIDFTARDLQESARKKGLPWEISKAFDFSTPVSRFMPAGQFEDINDIEFHLDINGQTVQKASTSLIIFPVEDQIAHISKFITLKTGDLLFTGTPAGVGPVRKGDRLEAFLEGRKMLDFYVR